MMNVNKTSMESWIWSKVFDVLSGGFINQCRNRKFGNVLIFSDVFLKWAICIWGKYDQDKDICNISINFFHLRIMIIIMFYYIFTGFLLSSNIVEISKYWVLASQFTRYSVMSCGTSNIILTLLKAVSIWEKSIMYFFSRTCLPILLHPGYKQPKPMSAFQ